jgi:hypothetical protein
MDRWRFDAMTRFLDALRTRRTALGETVAGLLVLAGLAGFGEADEAGARNRHKKRRRRRRRNRCRGGTTRCGSSCVNLNTDPNNCGRCGRECDADEQCRGGVCGCDVCDDDEACPFQTVQAAVDAAGAGATITICKGSYDGNVVVTKNLTLVGAGADDTKLEGEDGGSVVTIADGVTATIRGVTISGGTGTFLPTEGFVAGGGVLNRGTLTLVDAVVSNNRAERGGGILNFDGRDLTLDNTLVMDNRAVTDKPEGTFGGGILNLFSGNLVIRNGSAIVRNRSLNSAGIHNNGKLEMTDSVVQNNVADFDGAGIINDEGDARLSNTVVRRNTAQAGRGAGILNLGFNVIIENGSEIRENSAGTNGGGIFNQVVGTMQISDSAIARNEADEDGGGIYNIGGDVTLTRATVSDNEAGGRGGGAFNSGPDGPSTSSKLALESSTIRDNEADDGGGIFNTAGGLVTLDGQSSVTDNDPNNCVGTGVCPP